MDMLQEALQKLQNEIGEKPNDTHIRFLGGELIKFVRANPDKAALFADKGKSISGGMEALRKSAAKYRVGNEALINPDEVKAIILEYYGISREPVATEPVAVGFSVSVDDLL
jgi:hypothetical protein